MTVPLSKRKEGQFLVVQLAHDIRLDITKFLLRDFGIKSSTRSMDFIAKKHNISEEDKEKLETLLEKYNIGDRIIYEFPVWWVESRRKIIDNLCNRFVREIHMANGNWPNTHEELVQRRVHQTEAIATMEALIVEFEYIASVLNCHKAVDISKFLPIIDKCSKEQGLLRKWRKSDNKRYAHLIKS